MNMRSMFAKGAIGAVAAAMTLGATATAQAQPYGQYGYYGNGDYSYDACRRSQTNRATMGGLMGAGAGAVLGSNVAASGHRTDGSVLGGVVGAVAGAMIGHRTAACQPGQYTSPASAPPPPPPPPPRSSYYDRSYDRYADSRGYYGSRWDDDMEDEWAYGGRGERYRVVERPAGADGCTLAESPIYLPDGRVQKRFVRVCRDTSGRYQVVD